MEIKGEKLGSDKLLKELEAISKAVKNKAKELNDVLRSSERSMVMAGTKSPGIDSRVIEQAQSFHASQRQNFEGVLSRGKDALETVLGVIDLANSKRNGEGADQEHEVFKKYQDLSNEIREGLYNINALIQNMVGLFDVFSEAQDFEKAQPKSTIATTTTIPDGAEKYGEIHQALFCQGKNLKPRDFYKEEVLFLMKLEEKGKYPMHLDTSKEVRKYLDDLASQAEQEGPQNASSSPVSDSPPQSGPSF